MRGMSPGSIPGPSSCTRRLSESPATAAASVTDVARVGVLQRVVQQVDQDVGDLRPVAARLACRWPTSRWIRSPSSGSRPPPRASGRPGRTRRRAIAAVRLDPRLASAGSSRAAASGCPGVRWRRPTRGRWGRRADGAAQDAGVPEDARERACAARARTPPRSRSSSGPARAARRRSPARAPGGRRAGRPASVSCSFCWRSVRVVPTMSGSSST